YYSRKYINTRLIRYKYGIKSGKFIRLEHRLEHVVESLEEHLVQGLCLKDARRVSELSDRMHRKLRTSDLDRSQSESGREDRANGRSTRRVVADDHFLRGHSGLVGNLLEHRVRRHRRRVALVVIDLHDNSSVEGRSVVLLQLGRVVGMGGVCLVGRDQHRLADGAFKLGSRSAGGQLSEDVLGEGRLCSLSRLRSHLLVVVARSHTHVRARREGGVVIERVDEGRNRSVGADEIVEARARDELLLCSDDRLGLAVVEIEVEVDQIGGLAALSHCLAHEIEELRVVLAADVTGITGRNLRLLGCSSIESRGSERLEDRTQVRLVIALELGSVRLQMNGQIGNAHDRAANVDQLADELVVLLEGDFTGQRQISVEPRAPEAATVRRHSDLDELVSLLSRDGFHSQTGRVGVADDYGEAVARLVRAAHREREDGRTVLGDEVLLLRFHLPLLALLQLLEASGLQASRALLHRMEGRHRLVEEGDELGSSLSHLDGRGTGHFFRRYGFRTQERTLLHHILLFALGPNTLGQASRGSSQWLRQTTLASRGSLACLVYLRLKRGCL
ncbi:hypothetical protein PFISCL1PPCAC_11260, partial [Pristionchus fissidentatus]